MAVTTRRPSFVHFKHRNVPERELVRDLRRVARETGRRRVTSALYGEHGTFRPNTLARRFGSWNAALGAAGLPVTQRWKVPDAVLLKNLADVWRRLGRQPTWRELTKRGGFSMFAGATYKRRFGSWHKALRAFEAFVNKRPPRCPAPARQDRRPPVARGQLAPARHGADPRQLSLPHVRRQSGEGSRRDPARRSHRALVEGRTDRAGQSPDAVRDLQHRQGRQQGCRVITTSGRSRHPTAALKPPSAYRPIEVPRRAAASAYRQPKPSVRTALRATLQSIR